MKIKNELKNKKGITLIALVITIVVLLILAGVSIATLTGPNGLLTRANEAKQATTEAGAREKLQMEVAGSFDNNGNFNMQRLKDNLKNNLVLQDSDITDNGDGSIKVTIDGYDMSVSADGNIRNVVTTPPTIAVVQETIFKDSNSSNKEAVIPKGFKVSEVASEQKIDTGLVVITPDGSEFVWIPVDGILGENGKTLQDAINGEIILGRYHFNSNAQIDMELTPTTLDGTLKQNSELVYGFKEDIQNNDIKKFIKSVKENGGYYIARFEASQGANNKVESKSNKEVWNEITQPNAMDVCKNLYEEINSNLMNSYAWDTAILFIQKNSANNYSRQNSLNTELMNTGLSGDFQCNIYDMASNCLEWTTEIYDRQGYPYVGNGGHFGYTEAYTNSRNTPASSSSIYYSFRSVLYL